MVVSYSLEKLLALFSSDKIFLNAKIAKIPETLVTFNGKNDISPSFFFRIAAKSPPFPPL